MTKQYVAILAVVIFVITEALRQMPFILFGKHEVPKVIQQLSPLLPPAIMAALVVYCMKDLVAGMNSTNTAMVIAAVATAGSYKVTHNSFIAMVLGTLANMVLLHIL